MPRKKAKPPDGVAVAQPVSHLLPSVAVIHDFPGGAKGIDICPYVTASVVVIIIYYEPTMGPDLWGERGSRSHRSTRSRPGLKYPMTLSRSAPILVSAG